MNNKCECAEPGYCSRHQMYKDENMHKVCKTNINVFLQYEVDSNQIVEPNIFQKMVNLGDATVRHVIAGSPIVSDLDYQKRLDICKACPLYQADGVCRKCGCPVDVKARWATESCPLEEPKWEAIGSAGGCKSCGHS